MDDPKPSTTCVKCGGRMEFGILADSSSSRSRAGAEKVSEWIRGLPKRSMWFGNFKANVRDRLQVATLRCTSCGHLELYAPEWSNTCRGCEYDRTGLPRGAACPECGLRP